MIIVYHHTHEPGAMQLIGRLRKQGLPVQGRDMKYFNGEIDNNALEVYSPKYNKRLAELYGDRYKTKQPGRKKKDEVRND